MISSGSSADYGKPKSYGEENDKSVLMDKEVDFYQLNKKSAQSSSISG